jgi:hypothetical protein
MQTLGKYQVGLAALSLVVIQAAISFDSAATILHVGKYDSAYYFALARNISQGEPAADTVLWHYLGTPDTVARWAGDYWPPGWPMMLGLVMALVGNSMKHAIWICAFLSLAMPYLAFRITYAVRPQIWLAWISGLLVMLQTPLHPRNVVPAVTLPYQVFVLLAILLFVKWVDAGRPGRLRTVLVGALLAFPLWIRGDGFVVCGGALCALALAQDPPVRERAARMGWLILGAFCCMVPYWSYNLIGFGSVTPEPRSMIPVMTSYTDLHTFLQDPSFEHWWAQGPDVLIGLILGDIGLSLKSLPTRYPVLLGFLSLAAIVGGSRKGFRDPRVLMIVFIPPLAWFIPAIIAPVVADPPRLVMLQTPLLCILACLGTGWIVQRWDSKVAIRAVAVGVLVFGCAIWHWPFDLRNPFDRSWRQWYASIPDRFHRESLPFLRDDELVVTDVPWQLGAFLDVSILNVPTDGPEAFRQLVEKYRPDYLVLRRPTRFQPKVLISRSPVQLQSLTQFRTGVWYRIVY